MRMGHNVSIATIINTHVKSRFHSRLALSIRLLRFVTGSGKTGLIATITDIHFLPVRESCTHALPRNTKYLIIDGQVCFYRRLFTNAVKPPGCISWPWRALIGLHGVPGCSSRQSWPPLWILPVCAPSWGHSTAA